MQNVSFESDSKTIHGYLAEPSEPNGRGVIVIQEWWGLTAHIEEMADALAEAGFVALAPDLYGGRVAHDREEAKQYMADLPIAQAVEDLGGSLDYVLKRSTVTAKQVGVIGFCMGGGFVLNLAGHRPHDVGVAVPFYPVGAYEEAIPSVQAAVLGHFGVNDTSATPEKAAELRELLQSSPAAEVVVRVHDDAGHAFMDASRDDRYSASAADRAWEETTAFLLHHLPIDQTQSFDEYLGSRRGRFP